MWMYLSTSLTKETFYSTLVVNKYMNFYSILLFYLLKTINIHLKPKV